MLLFTLLSLTGCVTETGIVKGGDDDTGCAPNVVYDDLDGDGYGAGEPIAACGPAESGQVIVNGDCDDSNPDVSPAAIEQCNDVDDDCDGDVDDGVGGATWYADEDGDGVGGAMTTGCEAPDGALTTGGDCDDNNANIAPGVPELCDGVDQDCDTFIDEDAEDATTWYYDGDADGYGVEPSVKNCAQPPGFVSNDDDCDDTDAALALDCETGDPAGSVVCTGGYLPYTFTDTSATEPELILMGVYEPDPSSGGAITVDIDRGATMVLHLSSYTAVDWTINNNAGAIIDEILVSGYDAQTVNAPSGVPVTIRTAATTGTHFGYFCGYSLPYNYGGCDTDKLIAGVESYTGLTMASFAGCYQARSFKVE